MPQVRPRVHGPPSPIDMGVLASTDVELVGLLSWASCDGVLRGRVVSPAPGGPWTALAALHGQVVTAAAFAPDRARLFLGLATGVVRVYAITVSNNVRPGPFSAEVHHK